jgi:cytochrome c biogenesis protein CcdA
VPCSGAVYIAIISLLALQDNFVLSYGYLLVYKVMFILTNKCARECPELFA